MPDVIAVGNGAKSYSLDSLTNWSDLGIMPWATGSGNRSTTQLASSVAFMFRAVNLRAAAIADVPWAIYKGDTVLWESEQTVPASLSQFGNLEEMLYRTEAALCLTSTAYWYRLRNRVKMTGLQWLDPTATAPYLSLTGEITWFDHSAANGLQRLSTEDVVYIWNHGLSETEPASPPAAAAAQAAQALYNTNAFVRAFFERGAIKATLLTVDGAPSKEEREKLKSWWARMMGGVRNAFATEVISAAVKPIVIGEGISELSNTDLTREQREDIATALGVPHSLLMSNAANYATAEADRLTFYDTTVLPECNSIARQINRQLFAPMGLRFVWRPEAMNIYQANEEQRATAFAQYVAAGIPLSVAVKLLGIDLPEGVEPEDLDPQPAPPAPVAAPEPAQDAPADPEDDTQEGKAIEAAQFRRWLKKRPNADPSDFEAHYLSPAEIEELAGTKGVAAEQPPFAGKATRKPYLNGADKERQALEDKHEAALASALTAWRKRAVSGGSVTAESFERALRENTNIIRDALYALLLDGAMLGVEAGRYQVESAVMGRKAAIVSTAWDIANAAVIAWLVGDGTGGGITAYLDTLTNGIMATTIAQASPLVAAWAANGQPMSALVSALTQTGFSDTRARRIALTEVTRAYAKGNKEAWIASGVVDGRIWRTSADELVCPVCGPLSGQVRRLDEPFTDDIDDPPAHVQCLIGGTIVSSPRIQATSKRWYTGNVVEIRTEGGNFLTVTPNHPVLTDKGWIKAGALNVGDNVISSSSGEAATAFVDPNDYNRPAMIEDVLESFRRRRGTISVSVPITSVDFHGDGGNGDVEIVGADSLLGDTRYASVVQPRDELSFGAGGMALGSLADKGAAAQFFETPGNSAHSLVGSDSIPSVVVGSAAHHHESVGVNLPTEGDTGSNEAAADCGAIHPVCNCDSVLGLPGSVPSHNVLDGERASFPAGLSGGDTTEGTALAIGAQQSSGGEFGVQRPRTGMPTASDTLSALSGHVVADCIIEISRRDFADHVYNLQTSTGWYVANNIITHNCRCWTLPNIE